MLVASKLYKQLFSEAPNVQSTNRKGQGEGAEGSRERGRKIDGERKGEGVSGQRKCASGRLASAAGNRSEPFKVYKTFTRSTSATPSAATVAG